MILTNDRRPNFFAALKHALNSDGVFNFAAIFEFQSRVYVEFNNNQNGPLTLSQLGENLISKIYPDHLKNLKGQTHKIFVHQQPPRVTIVNGKARSMLTHFLDIIKKIENSQIRFGSVQNIDKASSDTLNSFISDLLDRKEIMMTLNTMIKSIDYAPKLMTYEETGFCPMVPLPKKESINLMFLEVIFD